MATNGKEKSPDKDREPAERDITPEEREQFDRTLDKVFGPRKDGDETEEGKKKGK